MSSPSSSTAPIAPLPVNRQARLRGPSQSLDPRVHVVRADIADLRLADRIVRPRYSAGVAMRCVVGETLMHGAPDAASTAVSALLFGEPFTVFDQSGGWAWGQCGTDDYVGWVAEAALGPPAGATHRITAPDALLFAAASIKSAVVERLPLNACVVAEEFDDRFVFLPTEKAWLHRAHLAPLPDDRIELALAFAGTPYRWGGRSRAGVDCSGLVQAVLLAHGIACPRDSDQQRAAFPAVDPATRRRGDLAFFPGHVGIMVDGDHILHANAHWMTTLIEPLDAVLDRLRTSCEQTLLGIARPPLSRP